MSIYQHDHYVDYLKEEFPTSGPDRGKRAKLVKFLGCQTSFISQVFSGRAHLALEHAIKVAEYLVLSPSEKDYLLTMVQKARAGSSALREYFARKQESKRRNSQSIQAQVKVDDVPTDYEQYIYYSSWIYAACHILSALPQFSDRNQLREYLGIEVSLFNRCLEFLKKSGFIEEGKSGLAIKRLRVHVDTKSPMIDRHHINWRVKAIEQIEKKVASDFHFSALYGISRKDAEWVREALLSKIKSIEEVVKESKEESPFVVLIDFWNL